MGATHVDVVMLEEMKISCRGNIPLVYLSQLTERSQVLLPSTEFREPLHKCRPSRAEAPYVLMRMICRLDKRDQFVNMQFDLIGRVVFAR